VISQAELDLRTGDTNLAVAHLRQVLALARGDGARHAEAQALIGLAKAHRLRGAAGTTEARGYATQALGICREFGYELLELNASAVLG
jgi:hypothetical protein